MSENHHDESEHKGIQPDTELSLPARRALAIHELLVEKGVIEPNEARERAEAFRSRAPSDGARVVAKAWSDPQFKERLLHDARDAVYELGYTLTHDAELAVIENTDKVHHLVVCTLCSCYPTSLLGAPPDWYKSFAYRQRAVIAPRSIMREFGLELNDDVQVKVVDSAADLRYMVLPRRPADSERMSEEDLAKLVTRDSMIGVSEPLPPTRSASETAI